VAIRSKIFFEGWAKLPEEAWRLRRRIDIFAGHLWLDARETVQLEGTSGSKLVISASTPFRAPYRIEAAIECENLEFSGETTEKPKLPPGARRTRLHPGPIDLRASPGGALLLTFEAEVIDEVERRNGFARVVARGLDAWIDENAIDPSPLREDRDHGPHCPDIDDRCPDLEPVKVLRPVEVEVGVSPQSKVFGTLQPGVVFRPLGQRTDYLAFELPDGEIVAPRGKRFFVRGFENALHQHALEIDYRDACPEGPPQR
jgi:hypothetical protein